MPGELKPGPELRVGDAENPGPVRYRSRDDGQSQAPAGQLDHHGRALASDTIRGVNPAAAQAASSAARTPVPRGRLTSGRSRSWRIVIALAPASG